MKTISDREAYTTYLNTSLSDDIFVTEEEPTPLSLMLTDENLGEIWTDIFKKLSPRAGGDNKAKNVHIQRTIVLPKESILVLSEFGKEKWVFFACKLPYS